MQYLVEAQTDKGILKDTNQDSLTVKLADTDMGEVLMAVICDGVGGLSQGEVASGNVVLAFQEWFYATLPILIARGSLEQEIENQWRTLVEQVNRKLISYGEERHRKLGTTVTAALFLQEKYYVIHVGDCRLYQIKDEIKQLTKDQTYIAQQIEQEKMTASEALNDSRRNMLLQCIGVSNPLKPDFFSGKVMDGASYLLCTDGFRHKVTEEEIYQYCCPEQNQEEQMMNQNLQSVINLVKNRQETDNISAILLLGRNKQ